jgi:hypothetical protein
MIDDNVLDFVLDAFNNELRIGTVVVYPGRDTKDKITFYRGLISGILPDKVQIYRIERSTPDGPVKFAGKQKRVWVELWKVSRVL